MSAAHHLDLSQSTCVTDRQTDGQNYDSQDRLAYARAAKNSIDRCKKTQFKRQCKDQSYKTAEIILLCHKVMCLFRTEPFKLTRELIAKRHSLSCHYKWTITNTSHTCNDSSDCLFAINSHVKSSVRKTHITLWFSKMISAVLWVWPSHRP